MKDSQLKMALKPYLERISVFCGNLSKRELTDILLSLAKEQSVSQRVSFLSKVESCLPGRMSNKPQNKGSLDEILNDIEALKESMEERIEAIEEGSYWDDADQWDYDYPDHEPDYVSEVQLDELSTLFLEAENLFLEDRLDQTGKVYGALFRLTREIEERAYISFPDQIDIREARARYCRCIYETSTKDRVLDDFLLAIDVDACVEGIEDLSDEDYPTMQDIIDAKVGEMRNLDTFLPEWEKELAERSKSDRAVELRLEAVFQLAGFGGVAKLSREWKTLQPRGYIFWLRRLKEKHDWNTVMEVALEALASLKEGEFRECAARFLIEAAEVANDPVNILKGKREKFFSYPSAQNLLQLLEESIKQNTRERELDTVLAFLQTRKKTDSPENDLFIKVLLMKGNLAPAVALVSKDKSIGWSNSNTGIVFGSIISVLTKHAKEAVTVKNLLEGYTNQESDYSMRFLIKNNSKKTITFYDEIVKGLEQIHFSQEEITNKSYRIQQA